MDHFILNKNNEKENIKISKDIFNLNYNEKLIHQLLMSYIANSHTGIKKQKTRGEVSGGGRKPWKQKGTGRARAGSTRSPLWRGGGKIFAFRAIKSKIKKINKKVYKKGIKIILSQLIKDNKITFIENINITSHTTKNFLKDIKYINRKKSILIIVEKIEFNLYLASRNIKNITIIDYKNINPFLLLKFESILITKNTINLIEERFK